MKVFVKDHTLITNEDIHDFNYIKHFMAVSFELALSLERMPKKFANTMRRKKRLTK